MRKMVFYVTDYFRLVSLRAFIACSVVIAVLIFCNYYFDLNGRLRALSEGAEFFGWTALFFFVFCSGYVLQGINNNRKLFQNPMLLFLGVVGPALFAWKMTAHFEFQFSINAAANAYWNQIVYWPLKLCVVTFVLFVIWRTCNSDQSFYGFTTNGFHAPPYFLMLLLMLPLLALAALQPDFLAVYPKLKNNIYLAGGKHWYLSLLYELAYGLDFVTIELFFRGFLILAFVKWVGKDAVLPMALFYCTIHFGKPLGECISSYFGGIILGAITLHTRSIWGGLIVHLGIAWLMEVFGALGHTLLT